MTQYPVHPVADLFPMMSEDELADLATDIKLHGLLHPIVLDKTGEILVDGRNRLRACELAGVEPTFEYLNGADPAAYIVSANLTRRNLSKGQQAMALAMIYPEAEKGGRGKKGEDKKVLETGGFSRQRVGQARAVLRHSRALAEQVLAGALALDKALEEVKTAQEQAEKSETKLAILQRAAPDLADLVADERMPIGEAFAAFEERQREAAAAEANKREGLLRIVADGYAACVSSASPTFLPDLSERLKDEDFRRSFIQRVRPDPEFVATIEVGAKCLAELLTSILKEGGDMRRKRSLPD